jgi:uncharacterized membrane protein YbjE (DUF340 family)
MLSSKDYTKMTLEELEAEDKKMKSQKITTAVFIGFLVGVAVWTATHNKGFMLTVMLLIFALYIGKKTTENMKNIQAEISNRNAAP